MIFVVFASLGLLVGPLCEFLGARLRHVDAWADGFALAVVTGVSLLFVLPSAVVEIGPVALALATLGAILPPLFHRFEGARLWSLWLVAVALAVHVVLDGAVLAAGGDREPLAWALVVHRLPVGFALVAAAQRARRPVLLYWGLALAMVAGTLVGYLASSGILVLLPGVGPAGLDALVAGLLLHVVLERGVGSHPGATDSHADPLPMSHGASHGHGHSSSGRLAPRWGALGVLAGMAVLFIGARAVGPDAIEDGVARFLDALSTLALESAPALLIGYALAGMVPSLLTGARVRSLAGGRAFGQAARGVAFGLPLPICSCGVLPLYESLVRRGAAPSAALAFFVATPELGFDAVLLSVPLLGSSLTLARVASAVAVALLVAILVGPRLSCKVSSRPTESKNSENKEVLGARLLTGLRFGFVEVFDHTMPWIALGLVVAAAAEPILAHGALEHVPRLLQVPVAALVGVPVYVCASGATPVAAVALHKGLSAGAAIAFLIAGPATNITTFGVLARLHGRRAALYFGLSVAGLAVVAGWLVDALGVRAPPVLVDHPSAQASFVSWISAACLVTLAVASLFRQGPRGALGQIIQPIHSH